MTPAEIAGAFSLEAIELAIQIASEGVQDEPN